ncbi:MAG TPA: hypothetical protein VFC46_13985 [Humisphaera sp.]|nr:hypothetical protein [Humisphaera sp.]
MCRDGFGVFDSPSVFQVCRDAGGSEESKGIRTYFIHARFPLFCRLIYVLIPIALTHYRNQRFETLSVTALRFPCVPGIPKICRSPFSSVTENLSSRWPNHWRATHPLGLLRRKSNVLQNYDAAEFLFLAVVELTIHRYRIFAHIWEELQMLAMFHKDFHSSAAGEDGEWCKGQMVHETGAKWCIELGWSDGVF